jgi:uncharacterized protein with HEPN domain
MSERGDLECLEDIEEAIRRIERYTRTLNYGAFLEGAEERAIRIPRRGWLGVPRLS